MITTKFQYYGVIVIIFLVAAIGCKRSESAFPLQTRPLGLKHGKIPNEQKFLHDQI